MKRLFAILLSSFVMIAAAARADDANSNGCGVVSDAFVQQDKGQVMINCVGVGQAFAGQLAGVLTYIMQRRLDPEQVIAKLSEIEGAPEPNVARKLSDDQGQTIIQSLIAKPTQQIAIIANPQEADSGDYAKSIAGQLLMAGWQIEGNQIRRVALPVLDEMPGLVLVVRDDKNPPEKALLLKKALAAAKILAPVVSDPTMAADEAMLWVGKRPSFASVTQ
jgi:hypothetical protein